MCWFKSKWLLKSKLYQVAAKGKTEERFLKSVQRVARTQTAET